MSVSKGVPNNICIFIYTFNDICRLKIFGCWIGHEIFGDLARERESI